MGTDGVLTKAEAPAAVGGPPGMVICLNWDETDTERGKDALVDGRLNNIAAVVSRLRLQRLTSNVTVKIIHR